MLGSLIIFLVIVSLVIVSGIIFASIITSVDISDGGIASQEVSMSTKGSHDIDLVMTWAGLNDDEERLKQRNEFKPDDIKDDVNRFADNGELLIGIRHAMKQRWLRRIYIVYPEICSLPPENILEKIAGAEWQEKIVFVPDSEILPKKAMPSFSSHPVEANFHRIYGLSERFIYTCDDSWLVGDIDITTFFSSGANSVALPMYSRNLSERSSNKHDVACSNTLHCLKYEFGEEQTYKYHHHNAIPLTKTGFIRTWELFRNQLGHTSHSKFRANSDIHPTNLVLNTMSAHGLAKWVPSKNAVFLRTSNDVGKSRLARNAVIITGGLRRHKTDFLCVNDDVTKPTKQTRDWFNKNFN